MLLLLTLKNYPSPIFSNYTLYILVYNLQIIKDASCTKYKEMKRGPADDFETITLTKKQYTHEQVVKSTSSIAEAVRDVSLQGIKRFKSTSAA